MNNKNDDKLIFVLWIVIWVSIFSLLFIIMWNSNVKAEKAENEPDMEVTEDNRPYLIEAEIELTASTDLSVIDKQISIHQYSEDDMQVELYDDSLEMLAICVEAEAGNQDLMGKRLVADVILNRVASDRFPDDIVSVITQSGQFATYTDGAMDRVVEPSEETFKAVRMELENRTDNAILFFTYENYNPYCTPAYKHGDHYFGY